ncbi:MAG: shikimate kinase [Candidatus Eremiobacteraeota bacterium]|nr:shikimate kinase [Candidatus Eremiobacteraeota bacterium]MBC5803924.1 shikimate kinase [Candidatus Eremiobacteraeota bacterium]MBC5820876.1 shikimate kinase [Candidatus Eremiobacteraeota bacterium]
MTTPALLEKHIALLGFMAAGKTTVGRHLARELGVAFCDSDAAIVDRHGPIAALFERHGEAGFRALEYAVVRELLQGPPGVLALGGGAVTHPPTRSLLAGGCIRVYLDMPAETLVARLRRSPTVRPLLGAAPTLARVRALLAEREPLYREADLVLRGPRRTQASIAHEIAARVSGRQGEPRGA